MSTKLRAMPDCPHCADEPLKLIDGPTYLTLRCLECNWHANIMPRPADDAIDAAIAEVVAGAKGEAAGD